MLLTGIVSSISVCLFPLQWLRSLVFLRVILLCRAPSSPSRHPAPCTSCLCCCASDSAAVTCHYLTRCSHVLQWGSLVLAYIHKVTLCSTYSLPFSFLLPSSQTLDSSELHGDGIILSLEEQLNALSLTSSPSPSGPDPKATVALNGTRFPSHLFEETCESTKVGCHSAPHPKHHLNMRMKPHETCCHIMDYCCGGRYRLQGIYRYWMPLVLAFVCQPHSFRKTWSLRNNCWQGQMAHEYTKVFALDFSCHELMKLSIYLYFWIYKEITCLLITFS